MVSMRGWARGLLAKVEVGGGSGEESTTSVSIGIGVDISVGIDIVNSVDGEAACYASGLSISPIIRRLSLGLPRFFILIPP